MQIDVLRRNARKESNWSHLGLINVVKIAGRISYIIVHLLYSVNFKRAPHDGVGLCTQETLTKLPRSTADLLVV